MTKISIINQLINDLESYDYKYLAYGDAIAFLKRRIQCEIDAEKKKDQAEYSQLDLSTKIMTGSW